MGTGSFTEVLRLLWGEGGYWSTDMVTGGATGGTKVTGAFTEGLRWVWRGYWSTNVGTRGII